MTQTFARRIQDELCPEFPCKARDPSVEIEGNAGRQAAARDDETGFLCRERVEAVLLFPWRERRPRQYEAELLTRRGFVDCKALARLARNRHDVLRDRSFLEQGGKHLPRRSTGRIDGSRAATQDVDDPGDVDAAAAWIVAGFPAAQFIGGGDPFGLGGDIQRGVGREGTDRGGDAHILYSRNVPIPRAALVLRMEFAASDARPVRARIASMVSGMTMAWLSTI